MFPTRPSFTRNQIPSRSSTRPGLYHLLFGTAEGVIEKVNHSEWASPIVAVSKKDGKFRICGDYKVAANHSLQLDQYPLPKPEDLFATLAGGVKFTTLDLTRAY